MARRASKIWSSGSYSVVIFLVAYKKLRTFIMAHKELPPGLSSEDEEVRLEYS